MTPMTDRELRELVVAEGPTAAELRAEADRVRRETVGDDVYLRGIVEFSSHCRCDCEYCGLRVSHRDLARFRMTPAQVVTACRDIARFGFGTVVLQSGEDPWWTARRVADQPLLLAEGLMRESGVSCHRFVLCGAGQSTSRRPSAPISMTCGRRLRIPFSTCAGILDSLRSHPPV